MNQNKLHPCPDVNRALQNLQSALCTWERNTGRESLLIFREAAGNLVMLGPQPSDIVHRWNNGISVDPANSDLDDAFLLRRFTDAIRETS
jgi:hypothetical protein